MIRSVKKEYNMRSRRPDEHPRQIQITGRNVICDTVSDREFLSQAKAIIDDTASAEHLSLDNLYAIRDTCQRYGLGKAQRALKIAIDVRTLPGPT